METKIAQQLPRLIYVGDVPVESSYHGSLLLYRLFAGYPKEKLLIVETDLARSLPERRLPGVEYRRLRVPFARLIRSRFSKLYSIWLFLSARFRARKLMREFKRFQPEAIISVAHGYHWITAALVAQRLGIPLHLIIHDHVPEVTALPVFLRPRLERAFQKIYRQARTRLCVSPYMELEYSKRYGATGIVLLPSRAADCPSWSRPAERNNKSQQLRIAFAGTIESGSYADSLRNLSDILTIDDQLVLFGPHTDASLKYWKLNPTQVKVGGLLPSTQLLERLRQGFDVLFIPMSFYDEGHSGNMRFSFPSKLADYTATGLPILICGPEYCSAVRWARENGPVAEVVVDQTLKSLTDALDRLRSPQHREMLGRRALVVGEQLFSHATAESILFGALACSSQSDTKGQ